jgi:hypothetical protein
VKVPSRAVTDQYLARMGKELDIVFDADLGELVPGHHIVARGIMLGRPAGPAVPAPGPLRDPARRAGDAASGGASCRRAGIPEVTEDQLTDPELHYEFGPALGHDVSLNWHWKLRVTDDAGTGYSNSNSGAFDGAGSLTSRPARASTRKEPPFGAHPLAFMMPSRSVRDRTLWEGAALRTVARRPPDLSLGPSAGCRAVSHPGLTGSGPVEG